MKYLILLLFLCTTSCGNVETQELVTEEVTVIEETTVIDGTSTIIERHIHLPDGSPAFCLPVEDELISDLIGTYLLEDGGLILACVLDVKKCNKNKKKDKDKDKDDD